VYEQHLEELKAMMRLGVGKEDLNPKSLR